MFKATIASEGALARFIWMRFRWSVIKALVLLVAVLMLFPAALPTGVFPLLVDAWTMMTGGMVGGL